MIFRTPGPWGAGKSGNLTAAELDTNFHEIKTALDATTAAFGAGVSIDEITTNGSQMTIAMSNGTSKTFTLPVAPLRYRGNFSSGMNYIVNDIITDAGTSTLYITMVAHTAVSPLDPDRLIGGVNVYKKMLVVPQIPELTVANRVDEGDFTLALTDARRYIRVGETDTGAGVPVTCTIPTNAEAPFIIGTEISFRLLSPEGGAIIIEPATGVTLNVPEGYLNQCSLNGATIGLKKVDTDEWDLFGVLTEA